MKWPTMDRTDVSSTLFYGSQFADVLIADWNAQNLRICGLRINKKNSGFAICGLAQEICAFVKIE
jgi:hypothetical protein